MSRWIDADKSDKKGRASRALSYCRYQTTAASAVSSNAFRNAENAQRNLVAVKPEQFAKAQVIPHPEVNPTPRAIMAGNQAAHPPVSAQRSAIMQHSPMVRPGQPPTTARSTSPPPPEHNHHYRSHARQHAASGQSIRELRCCPTSSSNPSEVNRGGPPPNRPPLVSKYPPPQEKLPYERKSPAMEQHPGRPLEPQQKQNLHEGKPAGPMQDREFPQHSAPAMHSAPPHAAPPPKH